MANMKPARLFFACLLLSSFFCNAQAVQNPLQYVNPLIGTAGVWFYGRTAPFVTPPFGMTNWTACTRNNKIALSTYKYLDKHIIGFRGTHKPAMWMGDYGYVTIMPVAGEKEKNRTAHKASFTHNKEITRPDYYAVELNAANAKKKIGVEMTSTERCGFFRIAFPKNESHYLFIEASQQPQFDGWIKIDPVRNEISGWNADRHCAHLGPPLPNFKGYFVLQFKAPIKDYATWLDSAFTDGKVMQQGNACGARLRFREDTVLVRIGTSFISVEQARDNLQREITDWQFEKTQQQTAEVWNTYFNRLQIEGATEKQKHVFYTGLYHCLLFPRQFSEYGRYYSAFDDTIHEGISYNDYSLWDTYRAEHPLLILTAPEHVPGMVQSLIQMGKEGGYMPKWPNPGYTGIMIGTHADAVIADALVKGIKGFDVNEAYRQCYKDAFIPSGNDSCNRWADRALWCGSPEARSGLSWYMKLGYVPVDKTNESVSNTLEGAYDDFCVAQVAKAVGKTDVYDTLMKRSQNYRNLYNPQTKFMAPRLVNGEWFEKRRAGFTEGGPWTYLFAVQQDVPGLINLLGGNENFIKRLDKNFRLPFTYWHENEPGHHYTYLYDYAGAAWKTQKRVAHYRTIKYMNKPHGLTGDEDCGQMSAWYIFSALGFYPVTPGTDVYAIGTPLFQKAVVRFDPTNTEKKFEIIAHNVSKQNKYVQSVTVNGKPLETPFLHHADIINGGQLIFEMGPKPNKSW